MAELTIPAGFTIAWVVLNLVGWYGGWRKGLELIHQDIRAHKTASRDIETHLDTLERHKEKVEAWRKLWWISDSEFQAPKPQAQDKKGKKEKGKGLPIREPKPKGPPDEFFQQLWGDRHFAKIKRDLEKIKDLFEEKERRLSPYMRLKEEEGGQISGLRRRYLKNRFILWDKNIFSTAIDEFTKLLVHIQDDAKAGWEEQRKMIIRDFTASESEVGRLHNLHPYHVLMAYCLAKIGGTAGDDVEKLRSCSLKVRQDFVIVVDADVFKLATLASEGKDVNSAVEYIDGLGNIRWKVDLLLREADKPTKEFVRVEFERSAENVKVESRIWDAFDKLISAKEDEVYFTSNENICRNFGLTRVRGDPSPLLQSTIQDDFAKTFENGPLTANELKCDHAMLPPDRLLPEISTYRAAFELAQATLLFLGTDWFGDLCRCGVWTGKGSLTHQFGFEMTCVAHKSRLWSHMDGQEEVRHIKEEFDCRRSWCATNYHWDGMNRGPRRLGLLLIELALGTVVVPSLVSDSTNKTPGAYKVENISVLVRLQSEPDKYKWKVFTRENVLSIAKRLSFHDKDDFQHAVEYCLTEPFPQSPNDRDREFQLKKFYFRVVKP